MAQAGPSKKAGSSKKQDTRTPEAVLADQDSRRLHDLALKVGVLSRKKAEPASTLQPSKAIVKCSGKDIIKKGHRKNKYLFSFPGLLAPVSAGTFGELAHLDTKNPVLYVNFPQGRLKLFGTILYPKNRYLTLHFAKGAGTLACEDCFESLVVFSEAWWIGKQEDNPEEKQLQMPLDLGKEKKHQDFSFTGGVGRPSEVAVPNEKLKQAATRSASPSLQQEQSSEQEGVLEEVNAPRTSKKLPGRSASKKVSYAEKSSSEGLDEDDEDSSESDSPLQKPPLQKAKAAGKNSSLKREGGGRVIVDLDSSEDEEAVPSGAGELPDASKLKYRMEKEIEGAEGTSGEGDEESIPKVPARKNMTAGRRGLKATARVQDKEASARKATPPRRRKRKRQAVMSEDDESDPVSEHDEDEDDDFRI